MSIIKKHIKSALILFTLIVSSLFTAGSIFAAGISIDAGLTPAASRWIFRSQMRYMHRDNDHTQTQREMKSYMFPFVVAYGIRSDITLMIRQIVRKQEMTMMGNSTETSGLTDLLIVGKYRLYRRNTQGYTFGIAPTLGLEIPSGKDEFTSDSWNLRTGLFVSGRTRSWGADFNTVYNWIGMAKSGDSDFEPGDEFTAEGALAYQLGWGSNAEFALSPVVEFSYAHITSDTRNDVTLANTGESLLLLSPGIKFNWSSFVIESLIQFPVWQDQNGLQTERSTGFIFGLRLMR